METKLSFEEKVKAFQALKTHAEQCAFFHAHPELGRIFGAHHFPKPAPAAAPEVAAPITPDSK